MAAAEKMKRPGPDAGRAGTRLSQAVCFFTSD